MSHEIATAESGSGQCLCGAVKFSIRFPTRWVAHCHCTLCQRAHGAAFVTWVSSPDGSWSVVDAEQALRWYRSTSEGERGFCSRCGSSLFFRSTKWSGELHIVRANFTTALDREPQIHAYYDTHVAWFEVNDALRKKPAPGS